MDTNIFVANFLINLVLTIAICSGPIVLYRFLVRREPVDKKKAKKISIIYGIIAFFITAIISINNDSSSLPGASVILWSYVNYRMLISGLDEKSEKSYTVVQTQDNVNTNTVADYGTKNKSKNIHLGVFILFFIAFFGLGFYLAFTVTDNIEYSYSDNQMTKKSAPIAIPEPVSGHVLAGVRAFDGSTLTVTASSNASCVVKLKTIEGINRMSFYVRAGDTVTVTVPTKSLYIYFASGKTWYGNEYLFGENTRYFKDDELIDFSKYTMEYTLVPVDNGNFQQTPIDADEF